MGFEQVFDNLTSKRMTAVKKKIHSVVDYIVKLLFWINAILSKF